MFLSQVLVVVTYLIIAVGGVTWYQGCFVDNSNQLGKNGVTVQSVDSTLVGCAKKCLDKSYRLVGIQKGDNCECLNETSPLSPVSGTRCTRRCQGVPGPLSLKCGGSDGEWSLYLSAGPYLVSLNSEIQTKWIVTNTDIPLDTELLFARFINYTEDSGKEWLENSNIIWEVDGQRFTANITGYGSKVSSRSLFSISKPGTFILVVTVSNAVSSLTRQYNVTVIPPAPRDLRIVPLNDSDDLPSCIPETYDVLASDSPIIAAFVNISVTLEVSVAVGTNLTFSLRHGKQGTDILQEYVTLPNCQQLPCHAITKDFKFSESGIYTVAASVSNKYGTLHENITVVVMERKLGNVTFDIQDNSYIHKSHEPVQFWVTVETTSRQHTLLRVNFGIGEEKKMLLREQNRTLENGTLKWEGDESSEGFGLIATYGVGCSLSIMFPYVYRLEGTFSPKIHISSPKGFLTMNLKQDLIIQNELSSPKLQFERTTTVNQSTEIYLTLHKFSVNLSVVWTILDNNLNQVDSIVGSYLLNYTFRDTGQYLLITNASNMINSVSTSAPILVQAAIDGLTVTCDPSDYAVVLQEVVCSAQIGEGTDAIFKWNFHDKSRSTMTEGNLTSTVGHKFRHEGEYPISLRVSNAVSDQSARLKRPIRVEKEIKSIHFILHSNAEIANEISTFSLHPECDCMVELHFDFGQGRKEYEYNFSRSRIYNINSRRNPYIYVVNHNFTSAGVFPVTVYAFNNVSNASNTLQVRVQHPVGKFEIKVQNHSVKEKTTVLIATTKGRILTRDDCIYRWHFPGGMVKETLIPLSTFIFHEVGIYSVNLTIRNLVDSVSKQREVIVHERAPAKFRIEHSVIVKTYEEVDFTLFGFNSGIVTVNYSYGEVERYFNQTSWKHAFSLPGVYELSTTIKGNGTTVTLQSYIAAQEPIRSLRLDGLSAIKIEKNEKLYTWTARHDAGSHLLYRWSLNNDTTNQTTEYQFTPNVFRRAGTQTVGVTAENDISSAEASMKVRVQYPILYIELNITPVPQGSATNVTLDVKGGKNFSLSCDFGDGNVFNTSSHSHAGVIEVIEKQNIDRSLPPIYRLVLSHIYKNVGEYEVSVTVANLFSEVSEKTVALVGEPISGVQISTDAKPIIALNTKVTVNVSVETGVDLIFEWGLDVVENRNWYGTLSPTDYNSQSNFSSVSYSFTLSDKIQILVRISNKFYPDGVITKLPFVIQVIEPIDNKTVLNIKAEKENVAINTELTIRAYTEVSDVVFEFDFGDGTTLSTSGTSNLMSTIEGVAVHKYTQVGVYPVHVIASNPLGSVTTPLKNPIYVQVPPEITPFETKEYCSVFGTNITFEIMLIRGTNVSFDWHLGDETELIDAGEIISHQYRTVGKKVLVVTAYNRVDETSEYSDVDVVVEIQGVNLTAPKSVVGNSEEVEYTAVPEPNIPTSVKYYNWTFDHTTVMTDHPHHKFAFHRSGWKIVTVAAVNCAGRAVSSHLEIQVMAAVESLTMNIQGDSLVNQSIKFIAFFWRGDDLQFTWNFGDGTKPVTGSNTTVKHTYKYIGDYVVNLTAENRLGSETITRRLFILDKVCKPPEVNIVGSKTKSFTFYKSDTIHIETGVKVNCSLSSRVAYFWSFINSTSVKVQPKITDLSMLRKQTLILPPLSLPVGEYAVFLKVQMKGEIVYTTAEMSLNIVPSPLKNVIEGGMRRSVSYRETSITLDGSQSQDPDSISNSHVRFNWNCQTFSMSTCYNISELVKSRSEFVSDKNGQQHQLVLTNQTVTIPVHLLLTNESRFLFVLTISTPDGRNKTNDQVIDIDKEDRIMRLKISCHQCRNNIVNPNEKISLRTECSNCPKDVQFHWSVFVVYNSYQTDISPDICGTPDERKILLYAGNDFYPLQTTSTAAAETFLTSTFPTTEKTTASEQDIKASSVEEKMPSPDDFYGGHFPPDPAEHIGSTKRKFGQQNNKGKPGKEIAKNDTKVTSWVKHVSSLPIHISEEMTHSFNLPADQTLTGLDKQSLVIKPRYLHQNKTFIVQVEASAEGMSHNYIAQTFFRVNRSPSKGRCTVNPQQGIELETEFTVFCNEWIDEDSQYYSNQKQSLAYEVVYRMSSSNEDVLVYRGASHVIVFSLPAGTTNNNYTVLVMVSILDNFGARTAYCIIPVVVRPKHPRSLPRYANNSVLYVSEWDAIKRARRHGDDRTLCILIGNIARRLNGLPSVARSSEEMQNRTRDRYLFLSILNSTVPMRDKGEVVQAAQSLVAATAVPSELNEDSLKMALSLLESIQTRAEVLYKTVADPNEDMLTLAIRVVSSIVGAAAEKSVRLPKQLTTKAITALDKLLKVELHHHSIGEIPIQRTAEYVSVLGSHYNPGLSMEIRINEAKFKLPSNMAAIAQAPTKISHSQAGDSTSAECFQAHLTTFKRNPFAHLADHIWKVGTEVLALNLYSCGGKDIKVANLTSDNLVEIQIPQNEKQKITYSEHVLEKKNMNIHEFNLTNHVDQPLHISIQLEPVSGRTFPISILISYDVTPGPKRFDLRRDFPDGVNDMRIFLPSGTLNRTGRYYLGMVDTHYNAGRHREGQVVSRNYTFSLWLGNCLFWDEKIENWSTYGCELMEESTADSLKCRCNHLTAFGGHFQLVPNDLTFVNIENFFNLNQNPVTIILVSLVFCVYFVLLALCRQADLHDEKKGGIVYLKDNGGLDKQQYEITIETGFRMGAGSTAKISIIIHGEEGMSETRELFSDDGRPLFERNSRDKFVMTHPDSLGKLKKVQLWHNNSGPSPSWYLSRVLVKDLVTGQGYYFLCEKWFAVEEEDGKVEREIMALDGNLGFLKVFWAKGTQYMADFHLWASLVTRPSYSRFTRTQRLTCCLTLLMSYMCLNAMWYKETKPDVRGEFGLLDMSWQNLTVGAIICAIIIPLNLLLSFLFRRSRVHFPGLEAEGNKVCEEHSTESPEESVQPTMMYSLLDQSILNWQSIQEWAQKQWLKREQAVRSGSNSVKTNNQSQSPQSQTTSTLPVLQTLRKEEETDVASSGFEDSTSQAYSQGAGERNRVQATPTETTPSPSPKYQVSYHREPCNLHTSRRIFLPFWCRYLAWTLCAVITIVCSGITILYGFRFGKTKSMMWIQSLYFSFMICIFIAQPFLILMTVVYTALRHRQDLCILDHYDDGFYGNNNEANKRRKQREIDCCEECEELERGVAARQRSRYLRFARPPQEKALIEARKKIVKEKKTLALFRDSVVYCFMFLLLAVMAYGKDTASPFFCNQAIREHFVRNGPMSFSQIRTQSDWYEWSQTSLLDALYKDLVFANSRKEQMLLVPLNSHLIGHVHIRQLRVQEEECVVYNHIPVSSSCRYGYSSGRRDDTVVGGGNSSWTRPSPYSFVLWGQQASYDDSGSTIKLSYDRSEALSQLRDLETLAWLDLQTRAVVVELTVLNVPTNFFSSVSLLLEFPPTGGAEPVPVIMSTQIFRYVSHWDNCVLACELFFVVLTMLTIRCELCAMVRQQKKYFSNLWNYVEMAFGLLSLVYIGCFMYRFVLVADIVEDLRNTFYEEFVNITFLATWDELLRSVVGMLFFFVIVKMLSILTYVGVCAKYSNIYKRARKELLIFIALFVFILCAFTGMGVALFGSVSFGLRNVWFGLLSMTALMTGITSHRTLEHHDNNWWPVFVVFYLVFGTSLLTSYMVAVLTRRLKVYKHNDVPMMGGIEGLKYLGEKFLFWSGIRRVQPMEEPENVLPPEFTMAEIEYQVDELLFRMNNLTGSSGLPEKPPGYLTDSTDASNGAGDDGISSGGSEDRAAMDPDRLGHRLQKIEDKLYANEPYLAQLIKLDSIGADVLSQEKEKQLRSHLELEVFRHLQMQRSESIPNEFPSNQMPVVMATLCGSSVEGSSGSTGSQKLPHLEVPKTVDSGGAKQMCVIPMPSLDSHWLDGQMPVQNPLSASVMQPEAGSSSPESPHTKRTPDTKPKVKVGPPLPPKPTSRQLLGKAMGPDKNFKPSSSSENASPQSSESEKHHRRTDSSSGHSGSVERGGSLKRPAVKPELPPKPTFIQTTLKEHSHQDSSKSSSQKLRQFKLPPDRVLQRGDFCGNIAAESSSGSEQDAAHVGRRPSGKRNLRKTKSRGKGKGSGSLSPALMLEDLALENPDSIDLDQVDMIEEFVVQEQEL